MIAAAHAVALDAGHARIFLAIDERHADGGWRNWLGAEASGEVAQAFRSAKKASGVAQNAATAGSRERSDV